MNEQPLNLCKQLMVPRILWGAILVAQAFFTAWIMYLEWFINFQPNKFDEKYGSSLYIWDFVNWSQCSVMLSLASMLLLVCCLLIRLIKK